jgi:heme-degrading monooxygenase HmoA
MSTTDQKRAEEQYRVHSVWPDGAETNAFYTIRRAAEIEAYLRQRYSGCKVTIYRSEWAEGPVSDE